MRPLVWVFLPLAIAYVPALRWIAESWSFRDGYYSHGPLVVALAVFLVLARRPVWRAEPARVDPRGWWLLGPALAMHVAGAALMIDSLSAASLVLALPGALLLAVGPARWRTLLAVTGLAVFCIPMPLVVTGRIAFELKEVAVAAGLEIARLFGSGAERHGAQIAIPGQEQTLYVAAACSGLRSLVALTTLGYCIAFFTGPQRGMRRWILLLAAVPVAIASNVLRIAAICGLAESHGVPFASGTGHDIASVGAWMVALGSLLAVDHVLTRRVRS